MMKSLSYYLIRPNANLIDRVMEYNKANDTDMTKIFLDTELWSKQNSSRITGDYTDLVKVMFIADLYSEYFATDFLQRHNPDLYKFFVEILGLPPYSLHTFDKWWQIEYLGRGVNKFEAYEQSIGRLPVDLFLETGNPRVDTWLESIKNSVR